MPFRHVLAVLLLLITGSFASAQHVHQWSVAAPGFIQNVGQFMDQNGNPNDDVLYLFHNKGFRLHLRRNGFSYEWVSTQRRPVSRALAGPGIALTAVDEWYESVNSFHRIDVHFRGSAARPVVVASAPSGARIHYYTPPASPAQPLHAPVMQQITYRNLYPGIDWVIRYDESDPVSPLQYYFLLQPGADAHQIQMHYAGTHSLQLTASGQLNVESSLGWITETAPVAFAADNRKPVAVQRTLSNGIAGFQLAACDDAVVIDPNLLWGTYYGGSQGESIGEVATDKQDKLIIAGSTNSSNNIATAGAHQTVYKGNDDLYVAKLKSNGKMEWASYLGGTNDELGYGVTTDKNNNVILLGKSQSGNQITTPGAYQTEAGGYGDNCIAKFTKDGVLSWCTLLGGMGTEHFRTAVCDDKANIYTCGFASSDNIKVSTKNPSYHEGAGDAFVVKFSPNGFPSWSAYLGGPNTDRAHSIALDQSGNIYLVGTTESSSSIATPGAHQTTFGGIEDAFVARLDSTGNELWVTYYGGTGDDHGRGIICNKLAHIYVCGYTNSSGVFGTVGSYQKNINSKKKADGSYTYDGFVAKFNYNGQRVWGSYYGGSKDDQLSGIDWDGNRNIYVGGSTASIDSISTSNAFQKHRYGTNNDGCFALFDSLKGTLTYGSFIGGGGDERMEDVTAGPNQLLYMVGTTTGSFYTRPDVWQPQLAGNTDAWLVRLSMQAGCLDELEPNETLAAATSITPTTDTTLYGYTAAIRNGNDQDWFKIKTTAPNTNLQIRLTDMTMNYTMTLYNSSGTLLATSYADPAGGQTLVYNHSKKKTYYLLINHDANTFDSVTCYRLRAWVKSSPFLNFSGRQAFTVHAGEQTASLTVYPNPTQQQLNIACTVTEATRLTVRLLTHDGRAVLTRDLDVSAGSQTIQIHLPQLSAGTYLLDFRSRDWQHVERIVIQ